MWRALFIIVIIIRLFRLLINDTLFNDFKSRLLPHRSAFDVDIPLYNVNYSGCRGRALFLNLFKFYLQIQLIDNIVNLLIQAINLDVSLVLFALQVLSVPLFRLYDRVTHKAAVGVRGDRSLDLLVLAFLGLEFFNVPLPLPLKLIFISHDRFVFLFCQEYRLPKRDAMAVNWELGHNNRLLEGGLMGGR